MDNWHAMTPIPRIAVHDFMRFPVDELALHAASLGSPL
jgi:hypothetical protein